MLLMNGAAKLFAVKQSTLANLVADPMVKCTAVTFTAGQLNL
jgi:hypothetical protein